VHADTLPPVSSIRQFDTHRLVPSQHGPRHESVLASIAGNDADLQAIFELDAVTNDRLRAAQQQLPGIGLEELVFGVPHAAVVNASFCHAHPLGSRFSGPDRGVWYAAFDLATSQAEVGFHKTVHLAEVGRFEDSVTFDDYLADFVGGFHDLRKARAFRACLDPASYVESQALGEALLDADSLGVVYPSARRPRGTCLACFRPAVVSNVRRGRTYRFTWSGTSEPVVTTVSSSTS